MSEQPQSIQPPDEPLDPYTLELAIDKLSDRIIDATDERDAEAVRAARSDLIALLATADPRARVVVLPEPSMKARGHVHWITTAVATVCRVAATGMVVTYGEKPVNDPADAREFALAILAAAEFAGGAQ